MPRCNMEYPVVVRCTAPSFQESLLGYYMCQAQAPETAAVKEISTARYERLLLDSQLLIMNDIRRHRLWL